MTAPKNGQARSSRPKPKPAHPHFVKAIVQVVGVVIKDGKAEEVVSNQVAVSAAEWDSFAAGLIANFEAQAVEATTEKADLP